MSSSEGEVNESSDSDSEISGTGSVHDREEKGKSRDSKGRHRAVDREKEGDSVKSSSKRKHAESRY